MHIIPMIHATCGPKPTARMHHDSCKLKAVCQIIDTVRQASRTARTADTAKYYQSLWPGVSGSITGR